MVRDSSVEVWGATWRTFTSVSRFTWFWVKGVGFEFWGLRVEGSVLRVEGSRVQGSGFRVQD